MADEFNVNYLHDRDGNGVPENEFIKIRFNDILYAVPIGEIRKLRIETSDSNVHDDYKAL